MHSQVCDYQPDGYKYGHETYYGNVTEGEIDLCKLLESHEESVKWFLRELMKAVAGPESEARNDIEE